MKAPLSWLKEYVEINLSPEKLGDRLTEIGLGTEKIEKVKDDVIFDFEITPNRPDLLSIQGIAREIAAVENKEIKLPKSINLKNNKPKKILPFKIGSNPEINPRFTGIIIDDITVKDSPKWLKDRLIKMGQRPINNIVDITNYVMLEMGNPIHAFDYEKIKGAVMKVHQAKGGENFTSVDGISYHLPKGAVIISDSEKIIDLCGIKGGENSGTYKKTKTIFLRVPIEIPKLVRKASQSLGLRSEASSIFERGVNKGGTVNALARVVELILDISGGEISSPLYDIKKGDFLPWKVNLNLHILNKILGIDIPKTKVIEILERLNLTTKKISDDKISVTIPTYRNDLQIEEDIIEEVARLYGYNNFPKTLPSGQIPTSTIPYFRDYKLEEKVKKTLQANGFSEVYSYSLVSEENLEENEVMPEKTLRVDNPVSREFEYLRPTLSINLRRALIQNLPNTDNVNLFELGKVYLGRSLDEVKETYMLSGISNSKSYFEIKGILERIYSDFGIKENVTDFIKILEDGIFFELNYDDLVSKIKSNKKFEPLPKYPPIIEDITITFTSNLSVGDVIEEIRTQSTLIQNATLKDTFENNKTIRIVYQSKERNLTTKEIAIIRDKILSTLKEKFNITIK